MKLKHWLGWCRPGHCPLDPPVPPYAPVWTWLANRGYQAVPCDCRRKHCQGWKVTR